MQEARAQARLEHPNICKVLEVGSVDNRPYIAMQFVDGLPFDQAARAMTLVEKVRVMRDAALAMHTAHEQGAFIAISTKSHSSSKTAALNQSAERRRNMRNPPGAESCAANQEHGAWPESP